MSAENFQVEDKEKIGISIIKRGFIKLHHQHGPQTAQIDDENQKTKFCFGETPNFIQVGWGYLKFGIFVRKADNTNFIVAVDNTNEVIRFVSTAFAYTFHDARISTSSGTEIEQNKCVEPISTNMRLLTKRDGDLSTTFDIIGGSEAAINNSSLKPIRIKKHTQANREVIGGVLPPECILRFCKSCKK